MAFGSTSSVFREWNVMTLQVSGTGFTGLDSDSVKVALYGNTGTPDKDAAVSLTGYGAATSAWVTGNEVTDATNWVAGGRALASKTFTTPATGVCMFDAADLAGGGNVTITNAYGCLVYDDTISGGSVSKQGVCFNAFGGAASVTAGTFTVSWSANGLARWTSS
jgi:hypothetical protein